MVDDPNSDVTLLTPVPEQHLRSGLEVCADTGQVTYGTDSGLVLSEFRNMVGDGSADILFYASETAISGVPKATFRGRFVTYVGSEKGKAPAAYAASRPATTADDGPWQSFYIVRDLRPLDKPIELRTLSKRDAKGKLRPNFVPLGPLIIDTPF